MRNSIFALILSITLLSCNMGRQYANYRAGGNSNKKEIQIKDSDRSETKEEKENKLEEITYLDTLDIKKIPGNKTMVVLKEKTYKINSCKILDNEKPLKSILKKNRKNITKKNQALKTHTSYNKKNFNHDIGITILIVSLVIGVIAFAISDSVVAAIVIAVLVALGMAIVVALAFCLALFFIFWIIFAAFGLI